MLHQTGARWTSSNIKVSNSSRATASRSRPATVAFTVDEAVAAAEQLGYPVVVKAQVLVGGRGKAGGIKLAANVDEARTHADAHPRPRHQGPRRAPPVDREGERHRAGVLRLLHARPRRQEAPRACCRPQGGVDIEEVAVSNPDAIAKIHVDPVDGLTEAQCRAWVDAGEPRRSGTEGAVEILLSLYEAYVDGDADLVRDQPAHPHHRRRSARARRQGHRRRQRGLPSPRLRGVRRDPGTVTSASKPRTTRASSTWASTASSASSPTAPVSR